MEMEDESSVLPAGQRKVYARESVASLGINIVGHPPEQVFVESVTRGGWAESQGLAVDDEVLAVNGMHVAQLTDTRFIQHLRARPCLMTIRKAEASTEVTAKASAEPDMEATTQASTEVTAKASAEANVEATTQASTEATAKASAEANVEATTQASTQPTKGIGAMTKAVTFKTKAGAKAITKVELDRRLRAAEDNHNAEVQVWPKEDTGQDLVWRDVAVQAIAEVIDGKRWSTLSWVQREEKAKKGEQAESDESPSNRMGARPTLSRATIEFEAEDDVEDLGFVFEGQPPEPLVIRSVEAEGWAKSVGIARLDEIVAINDVEIEDLTMDMIETHLKGRPLKLLIRGAPEVKEDDEVTAVANEEDTVLGVTFVPMPPQPVFAKKVREGTWGHKAGIIPGSEIIELNEKDVERITKKVFLETLRERPLTIKFIPPLKAWGKFEKAKKDPRDEEMERREAQLLRRERELDAAFIIREEELRRLELSKMKELQRREEDLLPSEERLKVWEEELRRMEERLKLLEEQLSQEEDELQRYKLQLEGELNTRSQQLDERAKELDLRAQKLDELQEELEAREGQVLQHEEDLDGVAESLKKKKQKLKERENDVEHKEQESNEREERLDEWEKELAEREAACGIAEEMARKREEEKAFRAAMAEADEPEPEDDDEDLLESVEFKVKAELDVNNLGFTPEMLPDQTWAFVRKVVVGGWADKQGLIDGDLIVAIDGKDLLDIQTNAQLLKVLEKRPIRMKISREGKMDPMLEKPKDKVFDAIADYEDRPLGLTPLTFPPGRVFVEHVFTSRWAARHGIQKGAEILLANGERVSKMTTEAFRAMMRVRPLKLRVKPITEHQVEPDEQLEKMSLDEISKPLGLIFAEMLPWELSVAEVIANSWAEQCNILEGSEITQINGKDILDLSLLDMKRVLRLQPLRFTFKIRDLDRSIREVSAFKEDVDLGWHVTFDDDLGISTSDGLVNTLFIDDIHKGGWAHSRHLIAGSEILAVNGEDVHTMTSLQLKGMFKNTRPLRIKVSPPVDKKTKFEYSEMKSHHADVQKMRKAARMMKKEGGLIKRSNADLAEESDGDEGSIVSSNASAEAEAEIEVLGRGRGMILKQEKEDKRRSTPTAEILLKVAPHKEIVRARAEQQEEALKKELQTYVERIRDTEELIFRYFDEDKLGMVSYEEFRRALEIFDVKLDGESFNKLMKALDPEETGQVPYEGFHAKVGVHRWEQGGGSGGQGTAQISEAQEELDEQKRKEAEQERAELKAFRKADEDASGKLSFEELRDMNKDLSDEEFADLMQKIDMDGDGTITLNEYLNRHLALQEYEFQKRMAEAQENFREREEEYFRAHLDLDGSGKITKDELRAQRLDLSDDEFEALWQQLDNDNSGFITKAEWITYQEEQMDKEQVSLEKQVLKSFNKADQDRSGKLTEVELRGLHTDMTDAEFQKMMLKLDRDGDGSVSKEEYLKLQEMERVQNLAEKRDEELTQQELAMFALGDTDMSGRITFEELKVIHPEMSEQALMTFWRRIDKDKDGAVTKEEWLKQFRLSDEERENKKAFEDLMQEVEKRDAELFNRIDVEGSGRLAIEEFHYALYPQLDEEQFQEILEKEKFAHYPQLNEEQPPEIPEEAKVDKESKGLLDEEQPQEIHEDGKVDKESKGFVAFPEFIGRYRDINLQDKEPLLKRLEQLDWIEIHNFWILDLDASGRLSIEEMHAMVPEMSDDDFAEMVRKIDREGDGLITVQEFLCRHVVDENTLEDRLVTSHRSCMMVELQAREADVEKREDEVALLFDELRAQFKERSETADRRDEAADKRDQEFEEYARKREEELWINTQLQREQLDEDIRRFKDREAALLKREEEVLQYMSDTFRTFDSDDSGTLTINEFKPALRGMGWEVSDNELWAMMRDLDQDGDGTISYQEFIKVYGLKRFRQERERKKEEPDEHERDYHNKRIVYQDWQRQEFQLRQIEEAKLNLEQQRKKQEFERSLASEAGALSTVLRLAMEHFALLGAGVASLADRLEEDLHQQVLQLVLDHAEPCSSYHADMKDLCSGLQKQLEELDSQPKEVKAKLERAKREARVWHAGPLHREEPNEESKEEKWVEVEEAGDLAKEESREDLSAFIQARENLHEEDSTSRKPVTQTKHVSKEQHKTEEDPFGIRELIHANTRLVNIAGDAADIFASPWNDAVLGKISIGEEVKASGDPIEEDGHVFVPIKPQGAVRLCFLNIGGEGATAGTWRSMAQREVAIDTICSTKRTAVDIVGGAFAAVLTNGSVIAWGHHNQGGDCSDVAEELSNDVRKIYATAHAFVALKGDGSAITWGNAVNGGEPGTTRQYLLSDVQVVYSTDSAFAALKGSGAVHTWGNPRSGGDSSMVRDRLGGGVKSVFSSSQAFAALKSDGSVCTWGHPQFGGDSLDIAEDLEMNVSRIYSTASAFAAVKFFGSVHTWGSVYGGAEMALVHENLSKQVHQVFSTVSAFAALKRDGSVVTWGLPEFGGDSEEVREYLRGVRRIYSTEGAFAALKKGGAVCTWGSNWYGGDSSTVRSYLAKGVAGVYSTLRAFAAVKTDGSVVTWGSKQAGGDSSALHGELRKGVRQVYSTNEAFAAVKTNGSVLTWGEAGLGGDSTAVQEQLRSGVQRIYATAQAFVAVLQDGTVQTWGNPDFGGDSSAVRIHLQKTLRIARPKRLWQPGARGSILRRSSLLPGAARHSLRVGASVQGEEPWAGELAGAETGAEPMPDASAEPQLNWEGREAILEAPGGTARAEIGTEVPLQDTRNQADHQNWWDAQNAAEDHWNWTENQGDQRNWWDAPNGAEDDWNWEAEAPGEIAGAETGTEPPNIIY